MLRTAIEGILKQVPYSIKFVQGSWYWDGQTTLKVHTRYMNKPPSLGRIKGLLDKAGVKYIQKNDSTFIIISL